MCCLGGVLQSAADRREGQAKSAKILSQAIGIVRAVQLVSKPGCFRMYTEGGVELVVVSAGDAFTYFV
jgi:hypothetical protein